MSYDFTEQVNAGIKLLDAQQPGWREQIDLDELDLGSCSVCVLGQLFGKYEEGVQELDIEDDPYKYGFNAVSGMAQLTQAWKDALGKDNTLVEVGDVFTDRSGCCAVKVINTSLIDTGNGVVTAYVVWHGNPTFVSDGFQGSTPAKDNLGVEAKESFEQGGMYSVRKPKPFAFKAGQFVTNNTGKVWYLRTDSVAREVKDQALSINAKDIDQNGLKLVTLPGGELFSAYVK